MLPKGSRKMHYFLFKKKNQDLVPEKFWWWNKKR